MPDVHDDTSAEVASPSAEHHELAQDPTTPARLNPFRSLLPLFWLMTKSSRYLTMHSATRNVRTILTGLMYAEAPRIHTGRLYVSDMYAYRVIEIDMDGCKVLREVELDDMVSGTGFRSDGQMLAVLCKSHTLVAHDWDTGVTTTIANMKKTARHLSNDMVVASNDCAYVGNFGCSFGPELSDLLQVCKTTVTLVRPGEEEGIIATSDMFFPNGSVISPDGGTLIVAETMEGHLTAFDRDIETGALRNRHVWANVGAPIDGICLDANGAVWCCVPQIGAYKSLTGGVVQMLPNGRIGDMIGFGDRSFDRKPIACMLRTRHDGTHELVVTLAFHYDERDIRSLGERNCVIVAVEVDVGPALMEHELRYNGGYC